MTVLECNAPQTNTFNKTSTNLTNSHILSQFATTPLLRLPSVMTKPQPDLPHLRPAVWPVDVTPLPKQHALQSHTCCVHLCGVGRPAGCPVNLAPPPVRPGSGRSGGRRSWSGEAGSCRQLLPAAPSRLPAFPSRSQPHPDQRRSSLATPCEGRRAAAPVPARQSVAGVRVYPLWHGRVCRNGY